MKTVVVTEIVTIVRTHVVRACDESDGVRVVEIARGDHSTMYQERARQHVLSRGKGRRQTRWTACVVPEGGAS